jgi:hypothetical protein
MRLNSGAAYIVAADSACRMVSPIGNPINWDGSSSIALVPSIPPRAIIVSRMTIRQ